MLLKPTHYLIPLIGAGAKLPRLEFHGRPGRIRHFGGRAGDHYHQHSLVDVNCCYFVGHVRLSDGEVADRASTLNTHRSELSPFLAERQLSLIGSQSAIRISLPHGLNFSRALTTSATFSDNPILRNSRAVFITFGGPQGHAELPHGRGSEWPRVSDLKDAFSRSRWLARGVHGQYDQFVAYGRYFEELEVGQRFRHALGRTITEFDDTLFSLMAMNQHPVHIDAHYAGQTQHGQRLVVGPLVISIVIGLTQADVGGRSLKVLEYSDVQHAAPVFHGDTLYAESTIVAKEAGDVVTVESRGLNQNDVVVVTLKRKLVIPRRPA
jgi:acyl dehydratase